MIVALKSNAAAPAPDVSGVEFATCADGMPVVRIDDRRSHKDERRFLVPSDEYTRRHRFGFVIDLTRHPEYHGPSSFVGWRGGGGRHDRRPRLKTSGEGDRRPARDPKASRMSDPADCGARRTAGDHGEGPEPGNSRSGPRLHHQEFADRLAFERWGELDALASRLAVQDQIIDELADCDNASVLHSAG